MIKEKYVGIPIEGGGLVTLVDETVSIPTALENLAANPDEVETGKAYWIGYNPQMLSVGARGEAAIPALLDFIKQATDLKVRHAGLLALHLVGIECVVDGRFTENFKNRKAREAMWELMKIEGLTDAVTALLKRDPWPADVPAIMEALAALKDDCPETLNALLRYSLAKRPVDSGFNGVGVSFTKPKQYTDRDFVRLAIEGIKANSSIRVEVEDGLPATHRECLVLFYLEVKSGQEAAEILGISEATFRVKRHRARASLRVRSSFPLGNKGGSSILIQADGTAIPECGDTDATTTFSSRFAGLGKTSCCSGLRRD